MEAGSLHARVYCIIGGDEFPCELRRQAPLKVFRVMELSGTNSRSTISASGAADLKVVRLPRSSLYDDSFLIVNAAEKRPGRTWIKVAEFRGLNLRPGRFAISPTAEHNEHPRPGYRTAEPSDSPSQASRYRPAAATDRARGRNR